MFVIFKLCSNLNGPIEWDIMSIVMLCKLWNCVYQIKKNTLFNCSVLSKHTHMPIAIISNHLLSTTYLIAHGVNGLVIRFNEEWNVHCQFVGISSWSVIVSEKGSEPSSTPPKQGSETSTKFGEWNVRGVKHLATGVIGLNTQMSTLRFHNAQDV